jgi:TrkA domain protein
MTEVEETRLPGVGVRHDFATGSGRRVGIIAHRSGDRELLIYDEDDPDATREAVRLNQEDAHTLGDLLGQVRVKDRVDEVVRHSIEGLTIDWVPVREGSAAAGRSIGDLQIRQRAGATVVAIVRGEETLASPGPEVAFMVGDTAVVIGTSEGVGRAIALLQGR